MSENKDIAIGILKRLVGNPKMDSPEHVQYEFNCPSKVCKNDKNKFNLNFNSDKIIFHCFKCGYHGVLHALAVNHGTQDDIQRINLLYPKSAHRVYKKPIFDNNESTAICELPEDYRPLINTYDSKYYRMAIKYLQKRRVSAETIKKYEIGYTEAGDRKFRIIIPSRNSQGNINYYDARSFFSKSKTPYLKPDSPDKLSIIFNEQNINFDLPVYLVEGVFDMFPLPNCIPLLGKDLSPFLISKLLKHKTKVILCLDEDAIKDTIKIYNELTSYGIDTYFVEVKDDIAKFYERYGKKKLIELLRKYRKPDFTYMYNFQLNNKKKKKSERNYEQMREEIELYKKQITEENNE